MRHWFALACAILIGATLCACTGSGSTNTTETQASPNELAASPSPSIEASGGAASLSGSPSPAPSIDPNLLAASNGTIVRTFPTKVSTPAGAADLTQQWSLADSTATAPFVFTFELPGVARIDHFAIHPSGDIPDEGASVELAVSTSGPQDSASFSSVATVPLKPGASDPTAVTANVNARWVRMTIQVNGPNANKRIVAHLEALGTLAARPANAPLDGFFRVLDSPYKEGSAQFDASFPSDAGTFAVTQAGASANAQYCDRTNGYHSESPLPGAWDGRAYSASGVQSRRWIANDEGTMFVGMENANAVYLVRSTTAPAICGPISVGHGTHNVVVIDAPASFDLYPLLDNPVSLPPYRFTRIQASQLNASVLASTDTIVWNMLCDADGSLDAGQIQAILVWIGAGHKLIVHDSDRCEGVTSYALLPYPFKTDNAGARGTPGKLLIVLESDTLGSWDRTDRVHFLDTAAYLAGRQEIGDANIVTTNDPHWCGHLFGSNADNVNGFMQTYARDGRGLIIYDGLDHDDGQVPVYQRIIKLELDQPTAGDLPCTRTAAASLVLVPDRSLTFVAGKAQTLHTTMQLYANQTWSGSVTTTSSGALAANVTPASFELSGKANVQISIEIPATTPSGRYPILVSANVAGSPPAQATITVAATPPQKRPHATRSLGR